jgi:hypothetical protein
MSWFQNRLSPLLLALLLALAAPVWGDSPVNIRSDLPDSDLHTLAGLSVGFLVAGVASSLDVTPAVVTSVALASALLVGLAKEMIDRAGYGSPETRDLLNTILGGAVASVGILFAGYTLRANPSQPGGSIALYIPLGIVFLIPVVRHL